MNYFSQDFWRSLGLLGLCGVFVLVGIGITNIVLADSSSIMELSSTTMGFMPPRMTTKNRNDIVNPTPGLLIYNTDNKRLEYYTGEEGSPWFPGTAAGTKQKMPNVPSGAIILWANANIPNGWERCPNMEKRFVAGFGGAIPGATLGSTGGNGYILLDAVYRRILNDNRGARYIRTFNVYDTALNTTYMDTPGGNLDTERTASPQTIPPYRNLYYLCKS